MTPTADFTKMHVNSTSQTPIVIVRAGVEKRCHNCHRKVKPNLINTKFLSRPLEKCPRCNSVIQAVTK